ncbi:fluoride efflux transporter FluC [Furfurilactobacillus sp. WILCCON 0119]|uniref:fluoride efflux transporter FluC n=1 Tax=Furfurilactobacillus entadae TaxID=2922307 RepID=UPI0035E7466F
MTRRILAVGGFAFVGGFLRELLELMWPLTTQWYGTTIAINISGAFLLAMVNFWLANRLPLPSEVILGLGTGMIGAFTTFSSFSLECVKLLQTGQWLVVTVYVLSSVIGGLAAASAGQRLAHWLLERTEGDWQ